MADIGDRNMDGGDPAGGAPLVNGGLLDPRTFPKPWPPASEPHSPDQDIRDEVERDILAAQAKLRQGGAPAAGDAAHGDESLERPPQAITGPLRTDVPDYLIQNVLNAQAGLPAVRPHPETWLVNGQPYLAISASSTDPSRSNGLTSMPTPADSAAATAGMAQVSVPMGNAERVGYIGHSPSRVVPVQGQAGSGDDFDTYTYQQPRGSPSIHGHIDSRPRGSSELPSDGFVDSTEARGGLGDAWSLAQYAQPMATVSHGQVGWHVMDNGQLKFLYPQGSMTPDQIQRMQKNLDQEQKKLLRPR